MAAKKETITAEIQPIKTRRIITHMVSTTPFIMHRFAQKAWQELLYPSAKKNRAERASSLKHNPLEEYRGCFYRNRNPEEPSLFHLPNGMIHKAMAAAALDMPGFAKTEIARWCSIANSNINLFGIPQTYFAMVRNSDQNRTPDVRMRPIFPKCAFSVEVDYKMDPLTDNHVLNLLGAAGVIVGIGDWRPQKGGSMGKFRLCAANDPEYKEIVAKGGRVAQQKAFEKPTEYDEDTAELLTWFNAEVARRRQDDSEDVQQDELIE